MLGLYPTRRKRTNSIRAPSRGTIICNLKDSPNHEKHYADVIEARHRTSDLGNVVWARPCVDLACMGTHLLILLVSEATSQHTLDDGLEAGVNGSLS